MPLRTSRDSEQLFRVCKTQSNIILTQPNIILAKKSAKDSIYHYVSKTFRCVVFGAWVSGVEGLRVKDQNAKGVTL